MAHTNYFHANFPLTLIGVLSGVILLSLSPPYHHVLGGGGTNMTPMAKHGLYRWKMGHNKVSGPKRNTFFIIAHLFRILDTRFVR